VLRIRAFRNTFPEMQCYLTNYGIEYPSDIDWIQTTEGDPFPVVMTVTLSFIEVYTPAQLRHFNRLNLKGGAFKTEKIGRGGCGIGSVGSGSSELSKVIDDKSLDGLSSISGNVSNSESAVINGVDGINGADAKKESFSEAVQKARDKTSVVPGSLYTKAQQDAMSNNFSLLPTFDTAGVGSGLGMDALDQYRQNLKSPLYAQKPSANDSINTIDERISDMINAEQTEEDSGKEQKNDF
jgi:hypothetical protein